MPYKGLGRGLGSLIPRKQTAQYSVKPGQKPTIVPVSKPAQKESAGGVYFVNPEAIDANPWQPRTHFDHRSQEELTASIQKYGMLQPLLVTKTDNNRYQLVAGERRLRAAVILKLVQVPVIVRKASDLEKLELSLIENIQRQDLNPIEEANAYKKLLDEFGLTQDELSRRVGKNRSVIANSLRILNLPDVIQQAIAGQKITMGHAKALLAFKTPQEQLKMFERLLVSGASVRQVEKESQVKAHTRIRSLDPEIADYEERLRNALTTKVKIQPRGKSGKIIIDYYSVQELAQIVKKISA